MVKTIIILVLFCWGIYSAVVFTLGSFTGYDDIDDQLNRTRSSLELNIDYGTGCQYLSKGIFGAPTPRVSKSGTHLGCSLVPQG